MEPLERLTECVWLSVTRTDNLKRERGDVNITLSKEKKCYNCDGHNYACPQYEPKPYPPLY